MVPELVNMQMPSWNPGFLLFSLAFFYPHYTGLYFQDRWQFSLLLPGSLPAQHGSLAFFTCSEESDTHKDHSGYKRPEQMIIELLPA